VDSNPLIVSAGEFSEVLVIVHQVATTGGIGFEAQQRRATQGSPRVESEDIQRLIAAILAAHPQGDDALLED